ncbi:hypothetical protein CLOBOL_00762 [Enterocloster bolteae ATCC BAA-613]|uniref:Uncharacterized protein n=1 Tax=Enterocloster bolteae (strain ATCC BAA-613 / DSM 15670 / CCUG 46953 / JCM 12243 / WAL 16351) TaxID=411902 RepID=A8RIR3_ENTBW|nr:hypothetical protein CLOBOL_00762 [Enterocloster bolteae ATCC BAA-613]
MSLFNRFKLLAFSAQLSELLLDIIYHIHVFLNRK